MTFWSDISADIENPQMTFQSSGSSDTSIVVKNGMIFFPTLTGITLQQKIFHLMQRKNQRLRLLK